MKGFHKQMPLIAMIFTQFIYAAMFMLNKAAISSGMRPSIFVVYRQGIAAVVLAPLAYFYERKGSPPLNFRLLFKIFIVSSLGITMTLDLHNAALKYVTATFATAITNMIPCLVFIIAVIFRIERLVITQRQGIAKVFGTATGLAGAMIYTFYKGPSLYSGSDHIIHNSSAKSHSKEEWIKGSLLMIGSNFTWSLWLIMQGQLVKEYPSRLRLMTTQCVFSFITASVYGALVERDISSWKMGWDVHLLSVVYCGVVVTSISYTLQAWVVEKKGPVYTASFGPLCLLLTAIFSTLFFHDSLHLGSVLGGVFLVGGLYAYLWGKNKEVKKTIIPQQKLDQPKSILATDNGDDDKIATRAKTTPDLLISP